MGGDGWQRGWRQAAGGLGFFLACLVPVRSGLAHEVALTVSEPVGLARRAEVVTAGVPMPQGAIRDVAVLRLLNDQGREIHADFQPLAFWGDKSIRWVLVTFAVTTPANGQTVVRLRDDGPPGVTVRSRYPWRVMQAGKSVHVITGGVRFAINQQFNLFDYAWVDANRNGRLDKEERIIEPSLNHGGVAVDAAGRRYTSSFQGQEIEIVSDPPYTLRRPELYAAVRVRGTHGGAEGGGFLPGMYDYEVTFTFHRDRPWVWVDYVLKNSPPQPRGEPVMSGYSVVTRLNLGADAVGRLLGEHVHQVALPQGQAAILYQDSDGTREWQIPPRPPVESDRNEQFQGFKLLTGPVGREDVAAAGLQARGFVELADSKWGMMAGLLDFWQTYPKAVEIDGSGRVVFHLFPARAKKTHWIEDQAHAGHRLVYALFSQRDPDRPSLEAFAAEAAAPLLVQVPPDYAARCGALHDLGPYRVDPRTVSAGQANLAGRAAERARDREYGWEVYGSSWARRTGRPPGIYDPLRDTNALFFYLVTGERDWFTLGLTSARHMRDIRAYHVDGVDVFTDYPSLEQAREALPVEPHTRPFAVTDAVRAYLAGRRPRSRWPLPDEAHLSLDEVYNLYLLTGDLKSLAAAREVAAAARAYLVGVPDDRLRPGREVALCLRALVKYHELVGHQDPRALADIRALAGRLKAVLAPARAAARADAPADVTPPADTGLFLRALAMAYRVTGDDDILDLAIGTGDWLVECAVTNTGFGEVHAPGNELKKRAERVNVGDKPEDPFRGSSTIPCLEPLAWLTLATGDPRYLETARSVERAPLLGDAARKAWASCLPYYLYAAEDADRIDTMPPAGVTDLKAEVRGQAVLLTWTAPGDNGHQGTADRYQVKVARRPITDIPRLPDQEGSHSSWWSATNVAGAPKPAPAGTPQSMTVAGLGSGTHFLALKAWDKAPNVGPLSNVVEVEIP